MSEPIKAGDLVMVVHQCCGYEPGTSYLGEVHVVQAIAHDGIECGFCGYDSQEPVAQLPGGQDWWHGWIPLTWLKRIPPLAEMEGEKRKEEMTA